MLGAAGAAAGVSAAASVTAGFDGGFAAACLVSLFEGFGIGASGRGLASAVFGRAGPGCCVGAAVASADALLRPTLRARLEKKPSDSVFCAAGAAEATRVEEDAV